MLESNGNYHTKQSVYKAYSLSFAFCERVHRIQVARRAAPRVGQSAQRSANARSPSLRISSPRPEEELRGKVPVATNLYLGEAASIYTTVLLVLGICRSRLDAVARHGTRTRRRSASSTSNKWRPAPRPPRRRRRPPPRARAAPDAAARARAHPPPEMAQRRRPPQTARPSRCQRAPVGKVGHVLTVERRALLAGCSIRRRAGEARGAIAEPRAHAWQEGRESA